MTYDLEDVGDFFIGGLSERDGHVVRHTSVVDCGSETEMRRRPYERHQTRRRLPRTPTSMPWMADSSSPKETSLDERSIATTLVCTLYFEPMKPHERREQASQNRLIQQSVKRRTDFLGKLIEDFLVPGNEKHVESSLAELFGKRLSDSRGATGDDYGEKEDIRVDDF